MGFVADQGKDDGVSWPGAQAHPGAAKAGTPDAAELADARLQDFDWSVVPANFSSSKFSAPSGPLSVISLGDPQGAPVVLVPGATGSKEDFVLMMPILAAAGYYTLSFDMAGQYESAGAGPENLNPAQTHYGYDLFVADLLSILHSLNPPAHVVGYSFAGTVAGLAVTKAPELFASLTLLSTPPLAGQSFHGVSRIGPVTDLASGRVGASLMMWGIRSNAIPVPAGRLHFVRNRFKLTRKQSVRDIVTLMKHTPDLAPDLSLSTLPKLVAVGEHDLWPTPLHAAFAQSLGAELAVYPSGHSPCETSPNQLCRDLLKLFNQAAP